MDLAGFGGGFGNGNGGGGGIAGSAHATKNGSPPSEMSARQASTRTRATGSDGAVFVVENSCGASGFTDSVPRPQRAAARALVLVLVTIGCLGRGLADGVQILACPACEEVDWPCRMVRALAGSGFLGAYAALAVFLFALRRGVDGLPCPRSTALL